MADGYTGDNGDSSTGGEVEVGGRARADHTRRRGVIYPDGQYAEILSADIRVPPAWVVALLAEPTAICRRRVTREASGHPVSVSTSWLPAVFAGRCPALLETGRIRMGTIGYVASRLGETYRVTRGEDELNAAAADAEDASTLHVPLGAPVLVIRSTFYAGHTLVEVGESVVGRGGYARYPYQV